MSTRRLHLVEVNPNLIVCHPGDSQLATKWDKAVVLPDLIKYVSASRIVKGTPSVLIDNNTISALSGIPFVTAAKKATPPLESIICSTESPLANLTDLGLRTWSPSELLDRNEEKWPFVACEMLFFEESVESGLQNCICGRIEDVFRSRTDKDGQRLAGSLIQSFEWLGLGDVLQWKWLSIDQEGKFLQRLSEEVSEISNQIAPIRSCNGIRLNSSTSKRQ
jgi:hypothetical protein